MKRFLSHLQTHRFALLVVLSLVSTYPVWIWYTGRVLSQGGEPWSLLPLATVVLLLMLSPDKRRKEPNLILPALLMMVYMIGLPVLAPIFKAAIVMLLLANLISQYVYGRNVYLPVYGLMCLGLPFVTSLQFYLGYPMRALIGDASVLLLRMNGYSVSREGTVLQWGDLSVSIDAPCSGIKLAWVALYMVFTLACFYGFSVRKTLISMAAAVVILLFANVLRTSSLFFTEAGLVPSQSWMHEGIGLAAFVFVAIAMVAVNSYIDRSVKW